MGNTTMVCGIKAEVAEPDSARPKHGFIGASRLAVACDRVSCLLIELWYWSRSLTHVVPNVDLPALSSPRFKPGPPGPEAQVFSNWLNDMLVS